MVFPHEELEVWQKALGLAERVYTVSETFPASEKFGLVSQIRRAAVSIPANIAEGKGRYSNKEFLQFLFTARGSLYETVTWLELARKLRYLTDPQHQVLVQQAQEVLSKLSGLINYLKGRQKFKGRTNPFNLQP